MRTVKLEIDPNFEALVDYKAFLNAVGYLSTWGLSGYDEVELYSSMRDLEITAIYRSSTDDQKRYVIGAIYNNSTQTFSFHS